MKLNSKGPYPGSEREIKFRRCLFTFSIKSEIRKFLEKIHQASEGLGEGDLRWLTVQSSKLSASLRLFFTMF